MVSARAASTSKTPESKASQSKVSLLAIDKVSLEYQTSSVGTLSEPWIPLPAANEGAASVNVIFDRGIKIRQIARGAWCEVSLKRSQYLGSAKQEDERVIAVVPHQKEPQCSYGAVDEQTDEACESARSFPLVVLGPTF